MIIYLGRLLLADSSEPLFIRPPWAAWFALAPGRVYHASPSPKGESCSLSSRTKDTNPLFTFRHCSVVEISTTEFEFGIFWKLKIGYWSFRCGAAVRIVSVALSLRLLSVDVIHCRLLVLKTLWESGLSSGFYTKCKIKRSSAYPDISEI